MRRSDLITIGDISARPGSIQYGKWEAFNHPTGHLEFLPLMIAQGNDPGPCLWLTAGIHGPEHTGPSVLYSLINEELVSEMRGTIVAIPALSPAGLRTRSREPYHVGSDPNRLWPDGRPPSLDDPDKTPPTSLEKTFSALFEVILGTADYLIDYHNAWIGSISFAFRDRILYRADVDGDAEKARAQDLAARQEEMLSAYGHTIVTEYPAGKYIEDKLHRSTSGAALLVGRIPAITVELGTGLVPDPAIVAASAAGTRNVMRQVGMLDGDFEPIVGIRVVDPGYPIRRKSTPHVKEAGVAIHLVQPGDIVKAGDPVARLYDIWGRPLADPEVLSDHDGIVLGRAHGIYYYPGENVLTMGVRDENDLIAPYPEGYFKEKSRPDS
jgi:predicted deacylase